jgi:hypothetical protein
MNQGPKCPGWAKHKIGASTPSKIAESSPLILMYLVTVDIILETSVKTEPRIVQLKILNSKKELFLRF